MRALAKSTPVLLSIAGFDPSGGAGISADQHTFAAFGCYPTAAISSITYQNTNAVLGARHLLAADVRRQIQPIVADFKIAGVKTGMLPTRAIISEVARLLKQHGLPNIVVDPVVMSTSGFDLIDDTALRTLIIKLFPLALLVTPNIPEAERLTGMKIGTDAQMRKAAKTIRDMGAHAVLIKGGHRKRAARGSERDGSPATATDFLDHNGKQKMFSASWIDSTSTHGTGCTLSAGIAACLGRGLELEAAVAAAKQYVSDAIRSAPGLGHGHGPVNHSVPVKLKLR